jgi:flavin reductase (DIM6/NTAB) family NADH-FMN oxidoreductase RutF
MNDQARDRVSKAIGRIPSGCSILTARAGGRRTGMLASWVQQAGFDPPTLSVAVKKGRPIERLIDDSRTFILNVLGENPLPMFKHFGRGFSPEDDAFAGIGATDVTDGVVIEDRVGWISAKVREKVDAGDHWLYIGEVIDADCQADANPYVHLRKNGLNY